jgi:hypothetical protein
LGNAALYKNTMSNNNVVIGEQAFYNATSGDENVAVGTRVGRSSNGNRNTLVGHNSGQVAGNDNVFIGYRSGINETGNNKLYIENSDSTLNLIVGDFSVNRVGINRLMSALMTRTETFQVNGEAFKNAGTGNWIIPSDRRLKENIEYLSSEQMLSKVMNMKGVTFNWKDKTKGTEPIYGFIAQELKEVFPNNVKEDKDGYLSASYGSYDPIIIESIKALKNLIDDQKKLIDFQSNKINVLERAVNLLTSRNEIDSEK